MFSTGRGSAGTGATAADCARLWLTLTSEYIPGLQLLITPVREDDDHACIVLEVVDDSAVTVDGSLLVNVWARKEFRNKLYLISNDQLFDLLITSYRAIERYFELGEAAAPARRGK